MYHGNALFDVDQSIISLCPDKKYPYQLLHFNPQSTEIIYINQEMKRFFFQLEIINKCHILLFPLLLDAYVMCLSVRGSTLDASESDV